MSDAIDLQPDISEQMQSEQYADPPIHVCVDSVKTPVRTQDMPRKAGAARTQTVTNAGFTPLLTADHRRAKATIIASGSAVFLAFGNANAQDTAFCLAWPVNVPYYHTATTDVLVTSATATPAVVSYATEFWATGE